jgi:molybdopterin-guanine dinucleotide biosynthesis protein A
MNDIPLMGVVLAGGKSSRMGTDKAELPHPYQPHGGFTITYLHHAVTRLRPLLSTIAISGRSDDLKCFAEVIAIRDRSPHQGPAEGVAESLRHAKTLGLAGILVTPVDMPNLETSHLQRLTLAWQSQRTESQSGTLQRGLTPFPIVVATFADQQPEPLLAIYPTAMLPAIETLANSSDRSLSRWLKQQSMLTVLLPQSAAKNVNRPEDVT